MKKIFITTFLLFLAMIAIAYCYFSKIDTDNRNSDISLSAATHSAGIIFCIENDKSVFEILKGQDLFEHLIGADRFKEFTALKNELLSDPDINKLFYQQNIYISFLPGKNKEIDFLLSTQFSDQKTESALREILKSKKVEIEDLKDVLKLTLANHSSFYLGIDHNLILISGAAQQVTNALDYSRSKKREQNAFLEYIKSNHILKRNSLANLFINFNQVSDLLKNVTTGVNGELSVFKHQNAYAGLSYNFSKEKLLFSGNTAVDDPDSYYNLFSNLKPQKIAIDNILPKNTANYTIYTLNDYVSWQKTLNDWFAKQPNNHQKNVIQNIRIKYHLDLQEAFPKYTKNQFVSFQLETTEKLGAVNLINGDKLAQQLLDISTPYNQNIRLFKESDLLYYFFGEPFKKFKRPYYVILDNYMIFSNNASSLQDFLNNYQKNNLLINTSSYSNIFNQLPSTSNIRYYINSDQSAGIFRNNLLLPYYRHYRSESGLKQFETFTYQLSGDNGKFQTNMLVNKRPDEIRNDTLSNNNILK